MLRLLNVKPPRLFQSHRMLLCHGFLVILLMNACPSAGATDATEIPWARVFGGTVGGRYISGAYSGGLNASKPAYVDIDNDGDLDLFIGESHGNINY